VPDAQAKLVVTYTIECFIFVVIVISIVLETWLEKFRIVPSPESHLDSLYEKQKKYAIVW